MEVSPDNSSDVSISTAHSMVLHGPTLRRLYISIADRFVRASFTDYSHFNFEY